MTPEPAPETLDAARRKALLDARSAALARRGVAAERAAATRAFLVCGCGPDRYGLPLGSVAQVLPARACTAVPGAPHALLGIVALSGRIVSVLDLARALGRDGSDEAASGSGHIVVLRGPEPLIALRVDRVVATSEVVAETGDRGFASPGLGADAVSYYAAASLAAAGPATAGLDGAGPADFVVIDLPRLLRRYLP